MMAGDRTAIRVAHVITGLMVGGAEMVLTRLLGSLPRAEFPPLVVSLLSGGQLAGRLAELEVPVVSLGMTRALPSLRALVRLRRELRRFSPAVVQGWMYHGNLAAWLGARAIPGTPVAWNIRQTLYGLGRERISTRLVIRAGAQLSNRVAVVVYNSEVARSQHQDAGFRPLRTQVIPNGFDTETYRPSADAASVLRADLGMPAGRRVVGLVSRYHPMKGHATFLEAARRVLDTGLDVSFVCAGRDVTSTNAALRAHISRLRLGDRVHLLGERPDTPRLFAGFDVTCCASGWGEGFPNVVGESMACGTPCVVTDVGDGPLVAGATGIVVPRDDPVGLAKGLLTMLRLPARERAELGQAARARIAREFSLEQCATKYAALYRETLARRALA